MHGSAKKCLDTSIIFNDTYISTYKSSISYFLHHQFVMGINSIVKRLFIKKVFIEKSKDDVSPVQFDKNI